MTIDWGSVPAWVAAGTAICGFSIAVRQLSLATKAQKDQVQIARANLLLSIDATYEGAELYKARKAVRSLRNRAEIAVKGRVAKNKSPTALQEAICEECSHKLDELWETVKTFDDPDVEDPKSTERLASDRYAELMALPYWFESVGMLCRRNLLPVEDILNLFDQVVITTMESYANHVAARRSEQPYPNLRFLENASWLLDQAKAYKSKRDDPPASHPSKSPTNWH